MENFNQYLTSIGMEKPLKKRIEEILAYYQDLFPDEIIDIFVADQVNDDGLRLFTNLWIFSKEYCAEAKQFGSKDDFDMIRLKNSIMRWEVQKQDFDGEKANEKSRFNLSFTLTDLITGEIKATRDNCIHLQQMFRRYIVPNIKKGSQE